MNFNYYSKILAAETKKYCIAAGIPSAFYYINNRGRNVDVDVRAPYPPLTTNDPFYLIVDGVRYAWVKVGTDNRELFRLGEVEPKRPAAGKQLWNNIQHCLGKLLPYGVKLSNATWVVMGKYGLSWCIQSTKPNLDVSLSRVDSILVYRKGSVYVWKKRRLSIGSTERIPAY
jgi:hypothetical protein